MEMMVGYSKQRNELTVFSSGSEPASATPDGDAHVRTSQNVGDAVVLGSVSQPPPESAKANHRNGRAGSSGTCRATIRIYKRVTG